MHRTTSWGRTRQVERLRGRALQREREALFRRQPFCAMCQDEGRMFPKASVIRDHVVPLAEGGTDDDENTQGLCHEHNTAKTAAESQRGRVRRVRR